MAWVLTWLERQWARVNTAADNALAITLENVMGAGGAPLGVFCVSPPPRTARRGGGVLAAAGSGAIIAVPSPPSPLPSPSPLPPAVAAASAAGGGGGSSSRRAAAAGRLDGTTLLYTGTQDGAAVAVLRKDAVLAVLRIDGEGRAWIETLPPSARVEDLLARFESPHTASTAACMLASRLRRVLMERFGVSEGRASQAHACFYWDGSDDAAGATVCATVSDDGTHLI